MSIRNYPFSIIRLGDIARPYLPVTIINPDSNKQIKVYALIDTGADECAFPASFAPLLGHNLLAGQPRKISAGNGVTIAYGHIRWGNRVKSLSLTNVHHREKIKFQKTNSKLQTNNESQISNLVTISEYSVSDQLFRLECIPFIQSYTVMIVYMIMHIKIVII
ncbi:MAG: hypothetical protein NUV76_05500 [Candidatus Kuenenia sp.]|nr:hypothetical protein [Candidatus Kuenenia sp.]